jgi:hypothetical protein
LQVIKNKWLVKMSNFIDQLKRNPSAFEPSPAHPS